MSKSVPGPGNVSAGRWGKDVRTNSACLPRASVQDRREMWGPKTAAGPSWVPRTDKGP